MKFYRVEAVRLRSLISYFIWTPQFLLPRASCVLMTVIICFTYRKEPGRSISFSESGILQEKGTRFGARDCQFYKAGMEKSHLKEVTFGTGVRGRKKTKKISHLSAFRISTE